MLGFRSNIRFASSLLDVLECDAFQSEVVIMLRRLAAIVAVVLAAGSAEPVAVAAPNGKTLPRSQRVILSSVSARGGFTESAIEVVNTGEEVILVRPHPGPIADVAGQPLKITGWAVDSHAHTVARGVLVVVDGRERFTATYGQNRADVARALHGSVYAGSGFSAAVPTAGMATGTHSLRIRVLIKNRAGFYKGSQKIQFFVTREVGLTGLVARPVATGMFMEVVDAGKPVVVLHPHHAAVVCSRGHAISVTGWAVDRTSGTPARGVVLTVDGTVGFQAMYGLKRPDVSHSLHRRAYTQSGFMVTFPTNNMKLGTHSFRIDVPAKYGKVYFTSAQKVQFILK